MPTTPWKKVEIPRQRKYQRRVGGKLYTIFPQPGGPSAKWALWQGSNRIGEFASYEAAKQWFDKHIIAD